MQVSGRFSPDFRAQTDPIIQSPDSLKSESASRRNLGLSKIEESPSPESSRKRSSSFTNSPPHRLHVAHRSGRGRKGAGSPKSDAIPPSSSSYEKQRTFTRTASQGDITEDTPPVITKSRSAQDLQPPVFDTNQNIRMQYLSNRSVNSSGNGGMPRKPNASLPSKLSQPDLRENEAVVQNTAPSAALRPAFHAVYNYPQYQMHSVYSYPTPNHLQYIQQRDDCVAMTGDLSSDIFPSLSEYSSRASVCESASASLKKEVRS